MKIKRKKMWEWIIGTIVLIIALIYVLHDQKTSNLKIIENGKFTTGKVIFFSSSKGGLVVPKVTASTPKPTEVTFEYYVNSVKYKRHENSGPGISYIPDTGIQEGDQYLVLSSPIL